MERRKSGPPDENHVSNECALPEELPLPLILFWNFNHFLVLEGRTGDRFFLNDPATGPRTVDFRTMNESFTGIALSLAPGPFFAPGGTPASSGSPCASSPATGRGIW